MGRRGSRGSRAPRGLERGGGGWPVGGANGRAEEMSRRAEEVSAKGEAKGEGKERAKPVAALTPAAKRCVRARACGLCRESARARVECAQAAARAQGALAGLRQCTPSGCRGVGTISAVPRDAALSASRPRGCRARGRCCGRYGCAAAQRPPSEHVSCVPARGVVPASLRSGRMGKRCSCASQWQPAWLAAHASAVFWATIGGCARVCFASVSDAVCVALPLRPRQSSGAAESKRSLQRSAWTHHATAPPGPRATTSSSGSPPSWALPTLRKSPPWSRSGGVCKR